MIAPHVAVAAESRPRSDDVLRVLLVVAQVAGVMLLVRAYELESRTVFNLLALVAGGFVVHALLPMRHRLPFFAALSVASVLFILGIKAGGIVLGMGAVLIGVCHLPIGYWVRVAILVLIAAVLFKLRAWTGLPTLAPLVWPVLGSMFMFRIALYMYSLKHNDAPRGLALSIAYFFMVPNVCFPLYPVVDYKSFVRTHFDAEQFAIYEQGVRFMLRGVVQLIVYRYISYDMALDSLYVNDLGDVVQYIASTFLLYIKVSGQFHLIVGVLCLFGFRLPETHHLYFLSSGFNDFWRRINIYWKDFMMKLVYYPSFFRLRRYGNTIAVLGATAIVFVTTWILHSYQFYWIRGGRLIDKRDIAFWGAFAVFVLGATLLELRPGRRVTKTKRAWSLRRGVTTVATFITIALLWSVWSAASTRTWLFMWTRTQYSTTVNWMILAGLIVGGVAFAGYGWGAPKLAQLPETPEPWPVAMRRFGARTAAVVALALLTNASVQRILPWRVTMVAEHLRGHGDALVNAGFEAVGYYEALTGSAAVSAQVPWRVEPKANGLRETALYRESKDFLVDDFAPSTSITFQGATFSTNRWGFRDREYTLAKAPGTYRIALMGPSLVMGWGVGDTDTFDEVLERKLNAIAQPRGGRVEILNFGAPGASLAPQVYRVEQQALRFSPDLIILSVHAQDLALFQAHLVRLGAVGVKEIPDSALSAIMQSVGVSPLRPWDRKDLRVVEEALDLRSFRWAQEIANRVGASVAVLPLRSPGVPSFGNLATTRRAALAANVQYFECSSIWENAPPQTYRVSEWDSHPNVAGHRKIAECMYPELARRVNAIDFTARANASSAGGGAGK